MSKNKGVEYFAELVGSPTDSLHRAEIELNGKAVPVWFSKLTAGQRIAINKGQKIRINPDAGTKDNEPISIDMSEFNRRQCLIVHYTARDEKGVQIFASVEEVQKLDTRIVDKLHLAAEDANKDEATAGN